MIPPADLLADPAWFPDRLDAANGLIRFVRTTHAILADSAFLDGRTRLGEEGGKTIVAPIGALLAIAPAPPAMRWIFHPGFSGSTLLARQCTVAGRALVLREPQILIDLANRQADAPGDARLPALRDLLLALLARRWAPGEAIVVKPSNWVDAALPLLWRPGDATVIADIAADAFLVAVLRGGRERIAFTLRLADRLMTAQPMLGEVVARTLPADGDTMTRAACLTAAAWWMQRRLIEARARTLGVDPAAIRLERGAGGAQDLLARAAALLRLDVAPDDLAVSTARWEGRHAKDDRAVWMGEEDANAAVRRQLAGPIVAGLTCLGQLSRDDAHVTAALAASPPL